MYQLVVTLSNRGASPCIIQVLTKTYRILEKVNNRNINIILLNIAHMYLVSQLEETNWLTCRFGIFKSLLDLANEALDEAVHFVACFHWIFNSFHRVHHRGAACWSQLSRKIENNRYQNTYACNNLNHGDVTFSNLIGQKVLTDFCNSSSDNNAKCKVKHRYISLYWCSHSNTVPVKVRTHLLIQCLYFHYLKGTWCLKSFSILS